MSNKRVLARKAEELLSCSAEARIEHLKKTMFVPYPSADSVLKEMEELLALPRTTRPPNLLIVGRSNNGKTHILQEFRQRHPGDERPTGDTTFAPVMFVQAPPTPDNRLFLDRTLHAFNIQPQRTATDSRKLQLVLDQMKACETRILLIDEIHSILAGPLHRREAVLNTFKYLSNESGVSIVAAGTVVARDILLAASELKSRFEVRPLTRWDMGQDLRVLLSRFETLLPLRQESRLADVAMARAILGMSEQTIGGIARVVRDAAIKALQLGEETITLAIVEGMQQQRERIKEAGARL